MLSIGRMRSGQGSYYLEAVARGAEDYYLGAGEAPGRWAGAGATLLGLAAEVDEERFSELFDPTGPAGGLVPGAPARRVPGFDLTFSAPKSVSLVWALGGAQVADGVRAAHEEAVEAALGYLEREAAFVRRGHEGLVRLPADGLVAAAFPHRTSRLGDPALHTHVLVANVARGPDGRWSALDGRALYAHARTAGFLYQAHLRHALTRDLGLGFGAVRRGAAEIEGVPAEAIRAFSRRRAEVEAELARTGTTGAAAAEAATLRSRPAKDRARDPGDLGREWRDRARALDLEPRDVRRLIDRSRFVEPDWPAIADALEAPTGLTHAASTFGRRDVLRALAEAVPGGADLPEVERRTDEFLSSARLVALPASDGHEQRFTTRELLGVERRLVDGALARRDAGVATVTPVTVRRTLTRHPDLSTEQTEVVRGLLSAGEGVAVVVGPAGTGKTGALRAAAEAWASERRPVVGASLAARAAQNLGAAAGIPSDTLHSLLRSAEENGLSDGCVVLLDEAGMVGTRQIARLAEHVARAEGKLVLVGDPRQLAEIEAGGALAGLARRLGAFELTENRRQHARWERDALALLRDGRGEEALAAYVRRGRVRVAPSAEHAKERMVVAWWASRQGGTEAIMIAARRGEVADLNRRARVLARAAGALSGPDLVVGDVALAVGDHVVAMRNNRPLGISNGTLGVVSEIDHRTAAVTITTRDKARVRLPRAYLTSGNLQAGYAITAHKAQGITVDEAHVLGGDGLGREWGYVALSRGREANHLYLAGGGDGDIADLAPQGETGDPLRFAARRLGRSQGKALAIDDLQP